MRDPGGERVRGKMGGPRREKTRGRGFAPLWIHAHSAPKGALSLAAGQAAAPAGAGHQQRRRGRLPPQQNKEGGCAPLQQRERGLCPPLSRAQGPRWAPGCPRPPAGRRRRPRPGWLRPPRREEGKEVWLGFVLVVFGGVVEMVVEEKELGRSWEESSPATWPEVAGRRSVSYTHLTLTTIYSV